MIPPSAPVSAPAPAPVTAPAPVVSTSAPPVMNSRVAEPAASAPVALAPAAQAPTAAAPVAATAIVETTLSAQVLPGATTISVASTVGFAIGDQILIGNTEMKTVVAESAAAARRLQSNTTITISTAMTNGYPAGTAVQKVPSSLGQPQNQGSSSLTSSSLSTSSAGYGWLVLLMLLCCLCLGGGGFATFIIMKNKKKKRSTTDREAYLKNEFIERQPVYDENIAQHQEAEPMLKGPVGADMNHDSRADMAYTGESMYREVQAPVNPAQLTMQPTQSFPVQVELAQPAPVAAAPVMEAPVFTFPGLPPIGGGSTLLQQQRQTFAAQPQTAPMSLAQPQYVTAQPQAASMNTSMPYGNYTTQSAYVSAPSAYSQQGIYPGGAVV